MKWVLRLLRNPSIHFFVTFPLAPIFAIVGESIGGSIPARAGWLLTLLLISVTAARSYRHERRQLPPEWPRKGTFFRNSPMSRYVIVVAMLAGFTLLGALFFAGALFIAVISELASLIGL